MKKLLSQAVLAVALVAPAAAADLGAGDDMPAITEPGGFEARWEVISAAYLWMPSVKGTSGVAGLDPVEVDASFSDLLENLDFGFMGVAEARYDRFGIFSDIMYTRLSMDGSGPLGAFTADVTNQMITATAMAEYRIVEMGGTSLDLMAGARLWGVTGDLEVTASGGVPAIGLEVSGDEFWVDPMIGVKTRVQGGTPWFVNAWAMIGGFGVSSEIDWDLYAGLGYEVNDRFSFVAGYRGLGVDYSNDGFVFDVIQHGPVLGGIMRF